MCKYLIVSHDDFRVFVLNSFALTCFCVLHLMKSRGQLEIDLQLPLMETKRRPLSFLARLPYSLTKTANRTNLLLLPVRGSLIGFALRFIRVLADRKFGIFKIPTRQGLCVHRSLRALTQEHMEKEAPQGYKLRCLHLPKKPCL